ncbi:TIGR00255 family protein [Alkalithermobacter thermoalcaliphilus JW-YL-7 = DSM 7308]|uniref:TIGR00255 family protein n=1 Tax=Alkalithermobacter thermoalcaliphilus JW-YL-7 = DSM 7308 TaxID=1121328 RepID=A0A150FPP0_CLOPD|nr:Conserved hypothetical protein CHP00255 [[Clostridium] paradoxum JW-YL-7 = DSM 7308]SHK96743.1 TIGR00255 family protein [[Clostridium] paradoxum JW-YL-7 = DSM 7308]
MAISMTGFGRGDYKDDKFHFIVETKTINHKYTDINIKLPRRISFLEEKIRSLVKEYIKRGRVDLFVKMEFIKESDITLTLDINLAKEYHKLLQTIKNELNVNDDISVLSIAKFPDVIKVQESEDDEDEIWKSLSIAIKDSLEKLKDMRLLEGERLSKDIQERCNLLKNYIDEIEKCSYNLVIEYKEKLRNRIKELLDDTINIDEERISQEVAIFADKSNITEEIVRFKSHVDQITKTINKNDAIGRKIDFLIQEINRETNTIASKSSSLRISELVVEIKSELEKIREQIQNIE